MNIKYKNSDWEYIPTETFHELVGSLGLLWFQRDGNVYVVNNKELLTLRGDNICQQNQTGL